MPESSSRSFIVDGTTVRGRQLKMFCNKYFNEHVYSLFSNAPIIHFVWSPQILHKLLFSNALENMQCQQEHLRRIVYAKPGGGGGGVKVYSGAFENREFLSSLYVLSFLLSVDKASQTSTVQIRMKLRL